MLGEAEDADVVLRFADTNEAGTNAVATEQSSNIAAMVIKQDGNIFPNKAAPTSDFDYMPYF